MAIFSKTEIILLRRDVIILDGQQGFELGRGSVGA